MSQAGAEFGQPHGKGLSVHVGQGVFPLGTQSFGDVSASRSTTIMALKNISWSSPSQLIL
jgi:hypothetical protein